MPPKSANKKHATPVALWYRCEICNAHICGKDQETHREVCPIGTGEFRSVSGKPLEYVRYHQIYTSSLERRTFSLDELQLMPPRYVHQLLFIAEGTLSLANLHIGQAVVIEAAENGDVTPLVRLVWPIPENFMTTIFVNDKDYNLYWMDFKSMVLKITPLPKKYAEPAKTLQLQLKEVNAMPPQLKEKQIMELAGFLSLNLKHFILTAGNCIQTDFLNKIHKLRVLSITSHERNTTEESELTQALENMNMSGGRQFFRITCQTRIDIICQGRKQDEPDSAFEEKSIGKAYIGGLDSQIKVIEEAMEMGLGLRNVPRGVKISRGMLLYGATGCGKSMLCNAMCTSLKNLSGSRKVHVVKINTTDIFSRYLGETEKNLAKYFQQAQANYPDATLILIEDIHNLCAKGETTEIGKRVCLALLGYLDELHTSRECQLTFLLSTTSRTTELDSRLRRAGRLDTELEIGPPTPKGRQEILECLLRNISHELKTEDIAALAQLTHAYTGADLANLMYIARLQATSKSVERSLGVQDLQEALLKVKPSAMREVLIESPNVQWSDIGGQTELKLKLQQAIEWPLQHPEKFLRMGIRAPRGLLMFGPPGCSKTMVAKALATKSKLNFLAIKGPELFSMWVGESERAVRDVFRKARQVAPAIVFFDEIDAIGGERCDSGGSGTSVKERVLTQLLTELDGVESLENVTIVAATNRPDLIDKALLRPGRIDRIVYVSLPDTKAREEIFRIKLQKMPLNNDVALGELVARTVGYSGAEIQAVCQEAALKTLEENINAQHITWKQFENALEAVQPRTSAQLLKLYEDYLNKYQK